MRPVRARDLDAVIDPLAPPEYAIRAILDGLGMGHLGLETAVGPMSGGERRRVALAALLVRDSDLLILDEPTNHLDVSGVDWLAGYLLTRRGALAALLAAATDSPASHRATRRVQQAPRPPPHTPHAVPPTPLPPPPPRGGEEHPPPLPGALRPLRSDCHSQQSRQGP